MNLAKEIQTSICIASRGIYCSEDYHRSYLRGIRSLAGHIYSIDYSAEVVSTYAPIIMYMAACMITDVQFEKIENAEVYLKRQHKDKTVAKALKFLKKRNPLAYAYSIKADELLEMYGKEIL